MCYIKKLCKPMTSSEMECFLKFSFLLLAVSVTSGLGATMGPPGPVKFYKFYECDPSVNLVQLKVELNQESDDSDSLQLSFDLASDLTEDATVDIHADECDANGENCEKDVYVAENKDLFLTLQQIIPTIWTNLKNQMTPKIEEEDRIPAGSYSIDHFQASYTDISVPQVAYARGRIELTVHQDDEVVLCYVIESEFFPLNGHK